MATPILTQILAGQILNGFSGGGALNLDGIPTVGINPAVTPLHAFVFSGGNIYGYELQAGTAATAGSPPTVQRPADYNGTTNQKNWVKMTFA
jgi:hypothetical protein